jgi:hypothetical protein
MIRDRSRRWLWRLVGRCSGCGVVRSQRPNSVNENLGLSSPRNLAPHREAFFQRARSPDELAALPACQMVEAGTSSHRRGASGPPITSHLLWVFICSPDQRSGSALFCGCAIFATHSAFPSLLLITCIIATASSPNVKDEPRARLARAVRQHGS